MRIHPLLTIVLLTVSAPAWADGFLPGETFMLNVTPVNGKVSFSSPVNYPDVLIYNAGDTMAFVGCGDDKIKANFPPVGISASGAMNATPIPPHTSLLLRKGVATDCAAVTAAGITTLYFTSGFSPSVPVS